MHSAPSLVAMVVVGTLLAGGAAAQTDASSPLDRRVRATKVREVIRLDGRDDDEVWQRAPVMRSFVERRPNIGGRPATATSFQVAFDARALYVLVKSETIGRPRVRTLERDSFRIFRDDTVTLKIDPGWDKRTAYGFSSNAAGARLDSVAFNDGARFEVAWDGVWEVQAYAREDGFNLEYRIPFALIGVPSGEQQTIGFNVTRDTAQGQTYDWRLLEPPLSPMAASRFGVITGIDNLGGTRLLELIPYARTKVGAGPGLPTLSLSPAADPTLLAGGEFKAQLTSATFAEVSVLTDFAETEVDNLQVQSGRFPLFFPERRQFFLRGLDIFDFGVAGSGQPFFTRRLGLSGNVPVQLLGGTKAYGRVGPASFGLLDVVTYPGAHDDPLPPIGIPLPGMAPPSSLSPPAPSSAARGGKITDHVFVGRGKLEATKSTTVGGLVLGSTPLFRGAVPDDDGEYAIGGLDVRTTAFDSRLLAYGFGLVSASTNRVDPSEVGFSGHGLVSWRGRYVRPSLSILWSDESFEARYGFYRRPGTAILNGGVPIAWQPGVLGLRELRLVVNGSFTTDPSVREVLTQELNMQAAAEWANGAGFSLFTTRTEDRVDQSFDLFGYTVDSGLYRQQVFGFFFATPNTLPIRLLLDGSTGNRFGTSDSVLGAGFLFQASRYLYAEVNTQRFIGDLGQGRKYGFSLFRLDTVGALTPNLSFSVKAQASLAPGDERAVVQSRFRWRYLAGSDLFVVHRASWDLTPELPGGPPPAPTGFALPPGLVPFVGEHTVTLKVTIYLPSSI